MKTVSIASLNPVKKQAIQNGFLSVFPDEVFQWQTINVPSGVSDQPKTNQETLTGAMNRLASIRRLQPDSDFWVAVEGGVEFHGTQEMSAFAWIVIQNPFQTGKARSASFHLPPKITQLVLEGKELGEADDIVFQQSNSKQKNGAVGLLTRDQITRTSLYEQAVILALIPFINSGLYR
ncbi:MAG: inositol monophosphatase [Anaerolineaceae bacterium]|nr:inositol monophosphatase [Anaerolineaceae bacterium]